MLKTMIISLLFFNAFNANKVAQTNPIQLLNESDQSKCYEADAHFYYGRYSFDDDKDRIPQGSLYGYDDVNEELYILEYVSDSNVIITKILYSSNGKLQLKMQSCKSNLVQNKKVFNKLFSQLKIQLKSENHEK